MRACQMIKETKTHKYAERHTIPQYPSYRDFQNLRFITKNGGSVLRHRVLEKPAYASLAALLAIIIGGYFSSSAVALEPTVFPGKGDRAVWNKAGKIYNEGNALANAKRLDAAIEKFEESVKMYPYSDCTYRNLAVTYEERGKAGDLALAEAAFKKATECDPNDWNNWSGLAGVLGKQEKYKQCIDAGIKALNCNPPPAKAAEMKASIADINRYLAQQKQ